MSAATWQWLAQGDSVTRSTAAVMLLMSVLSWIVILYKLWFMARARRSVPRAMDAFWQMPDLPQARARVHALDTQGLVCPLADAVADTTAQVRGTAQTGSLGLSAGQGQRLMRQLRAALGASARQLQWGQTLLATIGTGLAMINDPYNKMFFEIIASNNPSITWKNVAQQSASVFQGERGQDYLLPGSLTAILHKILDEEQQASGRALAKERFDRSR